MEDLEMKDLETMEDLEMKDLEMKDHETVENQETMEDQETVENLEMEDLETMADLEILQTTTKAPVTTKALVTTKAPVTKAQAKHPEHQQAEVLKLALEAVNQEVDLITAKVPLPTLVTVVPALDHQLHQAQSQLPMRDRHPQSRYRGACFPSS
jgi:hypothetical protein